MTTSTEDTPGKVFNIQHYSIHDGPGIRTTVFLMGCPLRCLWCQNPESQSFKSVLFYNTERCTGCGMCVDACPEEAIEISQGISRTDRGKCIACGNCIGVCPSDARSLMGKDITAGEVFKDVNEDAIFYDNSGGGITISGGDPVFQPDFTISILKLCRQAGMHTAIETCGFTKWETLERILEHVDLVLYDFKHMDPDMHKEYTGVSNDLILDNSMKIAQQNRLDLRARIPFIPGFNDSPDNLRETAEFVANRIGKAIKVHLLPYHRLGESKYDRMEEPAKILVISPPDESRMEEIKRLFESYGLVTAIGG